MLRLCDHRLATIEFISVSADIGGMSPARLAQGHHKKGTPT